MPLTRAPSPSCPLSDAVFPGASVTHSLLFFAPLLSIISAEKASLTTLAKNSSPSPPPSRGLPLHYIPLHVTLLFCQLRAYLHQ